MKDTFIKSSQIVNSEIVLVILTGVCAIQIFSGIMTYVSLAGLALSFFLRIVIYGRILAYIQGANSPPSVEIIKGNTINYIIVSVLISIPIFFFSQLEELIPLSAESLLLVKEGIKTTIAVVTIYVVPVVFIKNQGFMAVMVGMSYFINSVRRSSPIIILVVLMHVIYILLVIGFARSWPIDGSVLSIAPILVIFNVITTYLSFVIFSAAASLLLENKVA